MANVKFEQAKTLLNMMSAIEQANVLIVKYIAKQQMYSYIHDFNIIEVIVQ